MKNYLMAVYLGVFLSINAFAGEADVVKASAEKIGSSYTFHVTVLHDDEGWNHYADKWDVMDPDGKILGTRTLYHPHVGEQPFTRSLNSVAIPKEIKHVIIRAHDSVHKYGGKTVIVIIPKEH